MEESVIWLEKAAAQGHLEATFNLAIYYLGSKQNFDSSFKMMKQLAEEGFADAQRYLSFYYSEAWGTSQDLVLACKWGLLAIEGNAEIFWNFQKIMRYHKLTFTQISKGQMLAKEHTAKYGKSKPFD